MPDLLLPDPKTVELRLLDGYDWPRLRFSYTSNLRTQLEAVCAEAEPCVLHDHGLWLQMNHVAARVALRRGIRRVVSPRGMLEAWSLNYSTRAWASMGIQTVVGAFASYLTWMWMLRHYPATQMSTFTFLTPVFALVFGVVLLHEPLTLQLVLALVGVAVGIVLVSKR